MTVEVGLAVGGKSTSWVGTWESLTRVLNQVSLEGAHVLGGETAYIAQDSTAGAVCVGVSLEGVTPLESSSAVAAHEPKIKSNSNYKQHLHSTICHTASMGKYISICESYKKQIITTSCMGSGTDTRFCEGLYKKKKVNRQFFHSTFSFFYIYMLQLYLNLLLINTISAKLSFSIFLACTHHLNVFQVTGYTTNR